MGGAIATNLALARPDRVVSLVLIAPAGWTVGLGGIADTMYPSKARAIGWYLSSRAFLLPEHDPDWLAEPDSAASYTLIGDPEYQAAAAAVLQEFDFKGLRTRFRDLEQPTLVLWGTLDPVIPFGVADSVAQPIPCGRLISFAGALHRPQAEIPDTVVAEIRRFVENPVCPTSNSPPH
jgi:pimeloyl-ACP methyl ester carboxylesterase